MSEWLDVSRGGWFLERQYVSPNSLQQPSDSQPAHDTETTMEQVIVTRKIDCDCNSNKTVSFCVLQSKYTAQTKKVNK